jgi:hypothetical protein
LIHLCMSKSTLGSMLWTLCNFGDFCPTRGYFIEKAMLWILSCLNVKNFE